jgi:hypothetical protein
MPALTRRRSDNPHHETWHVYFGDVRVGTIGRRAGVPISAPQWRWSCGFYPGMEPGQHRTGIAESFEIARAGFEVTWRGVQPALSEAALDEWRRSREMHVWKERMWDCGCRLPTQESSGRSKCFCGEPIDLETTDRHIIEAHLDRESA